MDIVLTTKAYKLGFDTQYMYAINMYLYEKCSIVSDTGKEVKITRKEVKGLIDYIISRGDLFCNNFGIQQELAETIKRVYECMHPAEKMTVRWW